MTQHCHDFTRSHARAGNGLPVIEPGMPAPAGTGLTRRSMVLRSLGLGAALYGAGLASSDAVEAAINDALGEHKVLVSVFIDGGWDNLSILAPTGDAHVSHARALRPGLMNAIPAAQTAPFAADPSLSWHPSALPFRDLWDDPSVGLAVAPAVGYSGPNYSHFTSRHFWETGAVDVGGHTGWMGRYLDRVGRADVPIQGVTVGPNLSPTLATSRVPVSAVYAINDYKYPIPAAGGWLVDDALTELRKVGGRASGDAERDVARMTSTGAMTLADNLATASKTAGAAVAYPTDKSYFVDSLKESARLLSTRVSGNALPLRCVSLNGHGGFDTHASQNPTFASNLRINAQAIKAFWADLKARGQDDRVVMLVWSEFGRRPQENGSGGCDHGAAGTAMVIGKTVKQGLVGEFPGLKSYGSTGSGLMQDGNLRTTSDFRGIYSALLEQWMGTDAEGIIPGAGLKPGSGAFARPVLF